MNKARHQIPCEAPLSCSKKPAYPATTTCTGSSAIKPLFYPSRSPQWPNHGREAGSLITWRNVEERFYLDDEGETNGKDRKELGRCQDNKAKEIRIQPQLPQRIPEKLGDLLIEQRTKGETPAFFPLTRASHSISSKYPLITETEVVDDKSAHWDTWKQLGQEAVATCSVPLAAARSFGPHFWCLCCQIFSVWFLSWSACYITAEKTTKPPKPLPKILKSPDGQSTQNLHRPETPISKNPTFCGGLNQIWVRFWLVFPQYEPH